MASNAIHVHQQHPARTLEAARVRTLVARMAAAEEMRIDEVSIVLADHATVLDLNRRFLAHDYITDVLSFPLGEDDATGLAGEVYVDLDTAAERHNEFNASFTEEALRYVIHGVLHLMGYADTTEEGQQKMRAKEDHYLRRTLPSG
ncbi:MAG: rRNA maturation RNase YbeY [Bacteroidetes bacterium]|jgi:rRNA maturation RNase YbeY|nr:rRNA maturation RNase YbeY [Bacteroidota bacterium]